MSFATLRTPVILATRSSALRLSSGPTGYYLPEPTIGVE
jgi:hypothetical protein